LSKFPGFFRYFFLDFFQIFSWNFFLDFSGLMDVHYSLGSTIRKARGVGEA